LDPVVGQPQVQCDMLADTGAGNSVAGFELLLEEKMCLANGGTLWQHSTEVLIPERFLSTLFASSSLRFRSINMYPLLARRRRLWVFRASRVFRS
jgi:hypothetical protein